VTVSSQTEAAIREVIERFATQGERIVSAGRLALVGIAASRAYVLWTYLQFPGIAPVLAQLSLFAAIAGFSLFVIVRYRARNAPNRLFAVSVAIDTTVCFAALAATAFWPGPGYRGLVYMPDTAGVLIPAAAAGLRLSPRIAAFAGVLNLASLVGVVVLDSHLSGPSLQVAALTLTTTVGLLVAITLLAVLSASRARRLVREGAEKTLEAARAARNLGDLLRDHHDVRTLLSSASLNADLVLRSLGGGGLGPEDVLGESARQLREDLDRVNEFVANIKERAYTDLLSLRAPEPAAAAEACSRVVSQLRARFPGVELALADDSNGARAVVAGGAQALERLVQNLVVNACEGDGQRVAKHVDVRVTVAAEPERLRIDVRDDGPGFASAVLAAEGDPVATTKRGGSGLGLALVRELLDASDGRVTHANRPEGGAIVSVELPRAREARALE
jgi:signal transduction histidine kinase